MAKKRLRKKDIKEDRLVTLALTTSNYVQEHFTRVVSGLVILVAAVGIILFTAHARRNTAKQAEAELAIAMDQFLLGDKQTASVSFQNVADRYSGHQAGEVSMYFLGECYHSLYQYTQAIEAYDRYLSKAGVDGWFSDAAVISKALCHEGLQQWAMATSVLEDLSKKMDPDDARYPDVLFRIGVFYQEAGDLDRALEFYRRVSETATGKLKDRADVKIALLQ